MSDTNRFSNYREIAAKFPSTGRCGHPIRKGDRIGWNRTHGVVCGPCWEKWQSENAAADFDEQQYASGYGSY